jgi:hypothetical protein
MIRMALPKENPEHRAKPSLHGFAQGIIGGILIASFLPASALAKGKQPTSSGDDSLQTRVARLKQSLAQPSESGKISTPSPKQSPGILQWYNWNNWPNWGNWNNWPNWGNWLNW